MSGGSGVCERTVNGVIIDCHVHLTRDRLSPVVVEEAARLGFDKLCVSSLGHEWVFEPSPEVCAEGNRDVARTMREFPGLVEGFCYVNPVYASQARDEFRRCIERDGMRGLKLWVAVPASDPAVFPLAEQAIELGVPILQHSWHKVGGNLPHESHPEDVAELGRRYPEATIIMAHIAGDWERGVAAVRGCPNVLVDTSGSIVECGMVEHAVHTLGADRVVFGTDADGVVLACALGKVLDAQITDEERAKVLGGNMQRLLKAGKA